MIHRGGGRTSSSHHGRGASEYDPESQQKVVKWKRYKVSLYRHRRILSLAFLVCLTCYIRYLMDALPRVLRRHRHQANTLVVPFPIDGDTLLSDYKVAVEPLETGMRSWLEPKAKWKWYCYSSNAPLSAPRVLLAQYSGPSAPDAHYSSLLQYSSPVNMAYAKKWGMDYAILTGIALNDNHLIPPQYFQTRHSSFNKMELLEHALTLSDHYDWLWILDADALMGNLSMPVSSILPENAIDSVFLMAHRVNEEDSVHTFNINNGVTFWNLHHKATPRILSDWKRQGLNRIAAQAQLRNLGSTEVVEAGDQVILHNVLKTLPEQDRQGIFTLPYLQFTIVRHVVRGDHNQWEPGKEGKFRQDALRDLAYDICQRNAPDCDGIMRDDFLTTGGAIDQPFSQTGCSDGHAK